MSPRLVRYRKVVVQAGVSSFRTWNGSICIVPLNDLNFAGRRTSSLVVYGWAATIVSPLWSSASATPLRKYSSSTYPISVRST
jgi:hypothetical protein